MDRHHYQPHWSNFGILGGIFVGATVILTVLAICVDRRRQARRNYQGKTRSRQCNWESSEARQTNVRHPSHGARAAGGVDHASALGAVTAAGVLIPGMDTAAGGGGGCGGGGGW
jgi:hypothetical protein